MKTFGKTQQKTLGALIGLTLLGSPILSLITSPQETLQEESALTQPSTASVSGSLQESANELRNSALSLKKFTSKSHRKTHFGRAQKINKAPREMSVLFNDAQMKKKWGLMKTDALRAWRVAQGSKDVVIAIIDTGIDTSHPDLKENLWVNPGEAGDRANNGIDDDGNGFIDDVHGWNFVGNNSNLTDNHGHGTHIAGIVGARGEKGKGILGVAPKVSIMVLKYYDPKSTGNDNLRNTIRAINYARKMKKDYGTNVKVINYSGGGIDYSHQEYLAIKGAMKEDIMFVAAAGNERSNSDVAKYYPADYDLDNIISVTAVDPKTQVLPSSNYGVKTVDIAAPGQNIYSTLPNNTYGLMTGTSQATAFVSGTAALIYANSPQYTAEQAKKYILQTGDSLPTLRFKTGTSKKLNLYKALTILDQGVGLTGVVAQNTINMKSTEFTSENSVPTSLHRPNDSTAQFSQFSQALLRKVRQ